MSSRIGGDGEELAAEEAAAEDLAAEEAATSPPLEVWATFTRREEQRWRESKRPVISVSQQTAAKPKR